MVLKRCSSERSERVRETFLRGRKGRAAKNSVARRAAQNEQMLVAQNSLGPVCPVPLTVRKATVCRPSLNGRPEGPALKEALVAHPPPWL